MKREVLKRSGVAIFFAQWRTCCNSHQPKRNTFWRLSFKNCLQFLNSFGIYCAMVKSVYIKCPKCDLNFILKKDKLCPVCKQEMQALHSGGDDSADMGLCPICKVNYITEDENVCSTCMGESDLTEEEIDALYGGVIAGDRDDDGEDDPDDDDEELEILSMEVEGEDEEEIDEEEKTIDPLDDFDDTLDDDDEEDEDDEKF